MILSNVLSQSYILLNAFQNHFLFVNYNRVVYSTPKITRELMSCAIERTPFMWEKGRGDKCCPGPASCLPRARSVPGAIVSASGIRPWDGCHGAQRHGGVYLCQAPGGMVARGSGCAHRFSPKLRQPRHHFSVGLKGCRQQHLSPTPFIKKINNMLSQKETTCF